MCYLHILSHSHLIISTTIGMNSGPFEKCVFLAGRYEKEGGGIISNLKPMLSDDKYMYTALHMQLEYVFRN